MPPTEQEIRTYHDELSALVDNTLAIYGTQRDPWEVLANARVHLANHAMDEGDTCAWYELRDIQDCIEKNLADVCRFCGEMEGLHHTGIYCRKQNFFGDQRLSARFEKA